MSRSCIGLGIYHRSPDESRILLKRAIEKKSGDLVGSTFRARRRARSRIPVSDPHQSPSFAGYLFRDFAISPDGRSIAASSPATATSRIPLPR